MLNFLHHYIYPPLLTIACRAKQIKSDYNISRGSKVMAIHMNSNRRLAAILNFNQMKNFTDVHNRSFDSRQFSNNNDMHKALYKKTSHDLFFYWIIPLYTNHDVEYDRRLTYFLTNFGQFHLLWFMGIFIVLSGYSLHISTLTTAQIFCVAIFLVHHEKLFIVTGLYH